MEAKLSYLASGDSSDFKDQVAVAVGGAVASNIANSYTVAGTVEELEARPHVFLYALGRSRNSGLYGAISASWTVSSGLKKYPAIIGAINGQTATSVSFRIDPDMSSQESQSDSGYVRVSYLNELGQTISTLFYIRILDQTDRSRANVIAIFTKEDYLPNQTNPAVLESLFLAKYDLPLKTITKAPLDTVLEVYALLFSKRSGFSPKFKGLDTVQSWSVRPGVSVSAPTGTGSMLRYVNHYAPRRDTIDVTASMDSTRRIMVVWSYGTGRFLHLESRAGRQNDNVTSRLVGKEVSLLDQHISTDTVFASLRDEYGNFIAYNDTVEWRILNPGYGTYLTFSQTNPSVIEKNQNGSQEYTMTATVPSGSNVIGTGGTLASTLRDTLRIILSASGFDSMRVVVSGGGSFTSGGTYYPEFTSPALSSILDIRAGLLSDSLHPSFTSYIHKVGEIGILPAGWEQASQSIKWYYKNPAPFVGEPDTQYNVSTIRIKPKYHVAGVIDTLITEWYYNSQAYRDSIRFRTLPPYPAGYTITFRDTLTAGDSSLLSITFVDHNGQPVTDPSVLPGSIKIISSSTALQFRGSGSWLTGFDYEVFEPVNISFTGATSTNYVKSTQAGNITFTFEIARAPGDTVRIDKIIRVQPAAANNLRIMYTRRVAGTSRDTLVDCVADTMDVSAVSGPLVPLRVYTALLSDVYGNIIGSPLNSVTWSVSGELDTAVGVFSPSFNQLEYNAQSINSTKFGNIICRHNSTIADSFSLSIYASVVVRSVSTHEWYSDVNMTDDGDRLTINSVIEAVAPSYKDSSTAVKVSHLASLGYGPYRDGHLDYLNISFSSPVRLSRNSIDSIFIDGADTLRKYWKVKKHKYGYSSNDLSPESFDSVSFYAIVANDGTDDPNLLNHHNRYRIWLKPTPKLVSQFGSGAPKVNWSLAMETGLRPRIAFNDNSVKSLNASWVRIGTGAGYVTDPLSVTDSAAPLVSKVVFTDNICAAEPKANHTDIYFSEPLKAGGTFTDWRNMTLFTVTRTDGVLDSSFLANERIVAGFDARTDVGLSHRLEGGASSSGSLVYIRLTHTDSVIALRYLSGSGALLRFAQSSNGLFKDKGLELDGSLAPSVDVKISSVSDVSVSACRAIGPTRADLPAAMNWRNIDPETKAPAYPWWGAVLVNPLPNATSSDVADRKVRLTITIYDVIGNLVASPDFQKCLSLELDWEKAFGDGTGNYSETKLLGFNYLVDNVINRNITPCGVMLAWNCVNNKGRVVSPGGYLVRMLVDNSVNQTVSTAKLIIGNGK
jgi:hypothetical protein